MASNRLLLFILTLLPISLKASGHETTSSPFILSHSVSDTSLEGLQGRDTTSTRSSSSYQPKDEWFSPISEQWTFPTMRSPNPQLTTNTTSDQLSAEMATLVNFQCDVVAYKCSFRPFVANNNTGRFIDNSTDEEFAGMAVRPEEQQCIETQKAHVTLSSVSNLINFHGDFAFLQSCPPGYPHGNISELCRNPWKNQKNQTRQHFFLPVMSTRENLTTIASNVYCGLCNGFKAIERINVTFLCGDEMTADDVFSNALTNCKAVLSIMVKQSLIHFPYSLVKGLIQDKTKETDKSQTGTASDIFTLENTTSYEARLLGYDFHQLKNCLSDVTPSVKDSRSTPSVQLKVEFLINSNATKQNSKGLECDESTGLPFELRVCFQFSSSVADMKQTFVLSHELTRKEGQELVPETFTNMTECVSALTSHLSDFVTLVSSLETHLTSNSTSLLLSVKVTYSKRVFPEDVLRTVGKLKQELLPGCKLVYFSKLNRCLPDHTASVNVLLTESLVIKYPDATNLAIPEPDPCSEKVVSFAKTANSQRTLECKGYVLVTVEDITRLNKSNVFHLDETYIQTVNGEFWICAEYLDQINTASRVANQEDSTDKGQGFATVICISISLGALFVTFFFKIVGNKANNFPMKIMLNIMASLFMSQLMLLLMNISHPFICTTVAILSHYFWLSTFAWKLVCSVHMYKTFCKTQYSSSSGGSYTYWRTMICGYGAPLLIVLPTVVIHFCSCTGLVIGYGVSGCFILKPMVHLVTFAAPIGLCILINMILFARTIFQIHRTSTSAPCNHQNTTISSFRVFMKICSLSGFTWIFGYVGIFTNSNVVWYIFTILTGLQGVYIFMAFGLKNIQKVCRKISKFSNNNIHDPTSSQSTETLSCNSTKF